MSEVELFTIMIWLGIIMAIFFFVFREAAPFLFSDEFKPFEFLFSTQWYPTSAVNIRYGAWALIVGSISVTALAMALAVPFGLGAAIFLSEFCGPRLKETLKIRIIFFGNRFLLKRYQLLKIYLIGFITVCARKFQPRAFFHYIIRHIFYTKGSGDFCLKDYIIIIMFALI
jgi:hypothetical protein